MLGLKIYENFKRGKFLTPNTNITWRLKRDTHLMRSLVADTLIYWSIDQGLRFYNALPKVEN